MNDLADIVDIAADLPMQPQSAHRSSTSPFTVRGRGLRSNRIQRGSLIMNQERQLRQRDAQLALLRSQGNHSCWMLPYLENDEKDQNDLSYGYRRLLFTSEQEVLLQLQHEYDVYRRQ